MNLKKLACLLLLPFFITACGEENKMKLISCESPDVLNLVAEQFKQGNPGYFNIVNNNFEYLYGLLKRGGIEVPKNKAYHEDNEDYLAIQKELKINFDNITTIRIYEDIQRYNCEVDILFEAPDGSGGTWEGKKRGFFFSAYAMNGGEKIGLEYDDSIWKDVRYSLLKQFAQSAKLDNIVWVIFSNKELEILREEEVKLKEEQANSIKNQKIIDEIVDDYYVKHINNELMEYVTELVAKQFFNGHIVNGSDQLIRLYANEHNRDINELTSLIQQHESIDNDSNAIEARNKMLSLNAAISTFISKKLNASFDNDIRTGFCASSGKKIAEQRHLDETVGIKACKAGFERSFSLYISGDVIPTLQTVLKRHQLLIDNTVNEPIPF